MAFGFFKKKTEEIYEPIITEENKDDAQEQRKKSTEIYFSKVEEQKKTDPLIGVKLCGNDIYNAFLKAGREPNGGLNCTAFLFNLGCFAGYICQASVWKKYVIDAKMPVQSAFMVIGTKSGRNYYFGNYLNHFLGEGKYSFWSLVAGMFTKVYPDTPIPDVLKMVEKISSVVGNEEYKICDVVEPDKAVEQYSTAWKTLYPTISRYCNNPDEWPTAIGIAAQKAMELSKDVIKPDDCFRLLMESSIYMSKMDISKTLVF